MIYILYFRLFHMTFFSILKGIQELVISVFYAFLTYTFIKYNDILSKTTITDSELDLITMLGNTSLIFIMICLFISFFILVIRFILLALDYYIKRKKSKIIDTKLENN